jgi:hypothetical protein
MAQYGAYFLDENGLVGPLCFLELAGLNKAIEFDPMLLCSPGKRIAEVLTCFERAIVVAPANAERET